MSLSMLAPRELHLRSLWVGIHHILPTDNSGLLLSLEHVRVKNPSSSKYGVHRSVADCVFD